MGEYHTGYAQGLGFIPIHFFKVMADDEQVRVVLVTLLVITVTLVIKTLNPVNYCSFSQHITYYFPRFRDRSVLVDNSQDK
jgi:hypothetical protein